MKTFEEVEKLFADLGEDERREFEYILGDHRGFILRDFSTGLAQTEPGQRIVNDDIIVEMDGFFVKVTHSYLSAGWDDFIYETTTIEEVEKRTRIVEEVYFV